MSTLVKLRYYHDLLRFFITQRTKGFSVPETPHFDDSSTPMSMSMLDKSRFYLKYGSGGSTVVGARLR